MNFGRNIALWAFIALLLFMVFQLFDGVGEKEQAQSLNYSDFITRLEAGEVQNANIKGQEITGKLADGTTFKTFAPQDTKIVDRLLEKNVPFKAEPSDAGGAWYTHFFTWIPIIILFAIWFFLLRQMQGGGSRAMGFGKSRAKLLTQQHGRVTFDDVAGIEEAKEELSEVVEYLRDPHKFQRLGGKIPKGVLLVGPPGTGKTLLARAISGEANVPFFTISGSDFVEMFVGVGASRVRDLFEQGKKHAPCIIFIDELDAVGRHRGAGLGGGNDEREQTLNQLLVEMDGFESNEGVILIAATNRPDVLDPALLRPGRFDRQVVVPNPDVLGREQILKVHMRKVPLSSDVDPKIIARGTPGFSGADLANLVNEAALLAARRNKGDVGMRELEDAKDKVMMGAERRSMVMSDEEKRLTAYHEAGHAICALNEPQSDPIHKATIIPRGRALGLVMRLPEGDRVSMPRDKLVADLTVAMGGRVAEELIFGPEKVTTGASSDIKHATEIARRMVTEWGMSENLGPLSYGAPEEEVFLGHSVTQHKNMSDSTVEAVDREVKSIVDAAYKRAHMILKKQNKDLHTLAKGLLEFETLSGDEIRDLLKGKKIDRPDVSPKPRKEEGQKKKTRAKPKSTVPTAGKKKGGGYEPEPQGT